MSKSESNIYSSSIDSWPGYFEENQAISGEIRHSSGRFSTSFEQGLIIFCLLDWGELINRPLETYVLLTVWCYSSRVSTESLFCSLWALKTDWLSLSRHTAMYCEPLVISSNKPMFWILWHLQSTVHVPQNYIDYSSQILFTFKLVSSMCFYALKSLVVTSSHSMRNLKEEPYSFDISSPRNSLNVLWFLLLKNNGTDSDKVHLEGDEDLLYAAISLLAYPSPVRNQFDPIINTTCFRS